MDIGTKVKITATWDSEHGRTYEVVNSSDHAVWVITKNGLKWRYWNYEVEIVES